MLRGIVVLHNNIIFLCCDRLEVNDYDFILSVSDEVGDTFFAEIFPLDLKEIRE